VSVSNRIGQILGSRKIRGDRRSNNPTGNLSKSTKWGTFWGNGLSRKVWIMN
jgi:hypothetical protein